MPKAGALPTAARGVMKFNISGFKAVSMKLTLPVGRLGADAKLESAEPQKP